MKGPYGWTQPVFKHNPICHTFLLHIPTQNFNCFYMMSLQFRLYLSQDLHFYVTEGILGSCMSHVID